ncbi:SDR family NAD(P)-dependent oxidoreductase [Aeoliella sp. SH292]|uniref:SDR family NAD(P)-dependent oxidoreductase n=1 Tax=Aeoliella sp. SH292 TaxID=3454464 RepID=UPI003F965A9E
MVGRGQRMNNGNLMTPSPSDIKNPQPLAGQTALVTGSSSGIGRAIALAFAAAGADVHLHTRRNTAGMVEVRKLIAATGAGGRHFTFDLADPKACEQLVTEVGPLDILVNNAGVDVLTGEAANWSFDEKLAALWQVDVRATIDLSRAIGEQMRERGHGVILNMGWDQADVGMEGDSGEMFATVKGAVMAFTKSLAKSLAPTVRVNCLAPGWIRTKWSGGGSDYWDRRARGEALVGRWGTAEDVAAAAVYLASPAASFITGHVLPINGGFAGSYRE